MRAGRTPWNVIESVLGLLAGLVLAFSGYRLARNLAALAGFLAGFVLGLVLGIFAGPAAIVVGVVMGVVFAILFVVAFRLVGGALGAVLGVALALSLAWPTWGVVLAGIVGGIVGLAANRVVIAGATAIAGAWLAVRSGLELLQDGGMRPLDNEPLVTLVATGILAALGFLSQVRELQRSPH